MWHLCNCAARPCVPVVMSELSLTSSLYMHIMPLMLHAAASFPFDDVLHRIEVPHHSLTAVLNDRRQHYTGHLSVCIQLQQSLLSQWSEPHPLRVCIAGHMWKRVASCSSASQLKPAVAFLPSVQPIGCFRTAGRGMEHGGCRSTGQAGSVQIYQQQRPAASLFERC